MYKLCFNIKIATNIKIERPKNLILKYENYFCEFVKISESIIQLNIFDRTLISFKQGVCPDFCFSNIKRLDPI